MGDSPRRLGAPLRRLVALLAAAATLGAGAFAVPAAASPAAPIPARSGQVVAAERADAPSLSLAQANIYTGLSTERFQADVRRVLGLGTDFITYNEVPYRTDAVMAPAGYDIYRSMRNRYTAATPVAWRSDRWTALDQGVSRVSNWRGRPPGRVVEIGRRFANWVTLADGHGRVVSVVSAHLAPESRGMPDLVRRSVTRLGALVDSLAPRGPVLVGGDFNVHYRSGRYPAALLAEHGMVPTYDTLGRYFATGDHQGATIDYVFNRGGDSLIATSQYPVELASDHDAVVGGFSWLSDPPGSTTTVSNDPSAGAARVVVRALLSRVRRARPGATLQLASSRLALQRLTHALRNALARGVHVQLVAVGGELGERERLVRRTAGGVDDPASWVHRCTRECAATWRKLDGVGAMMVVIGADGTGVARLDSSRRFVDAVVARPTTLRISTGSLTVTAGRRLLASLD